MSQERVTVKDIVSELGYLVKTGDADGFLERLEYASKMREFEKRTHTPEFQAIVKKYIEKLSRGAADSMIILADQDGHVHLIRK